MATQPKKLGVSKNSARYLGLRVNQKVVQFVEMEVNEQVGEPALKKQKKMQAAVPEKNGEQPQKQQNPTEGDKEKLQNQEDAPQSNQQTNPSDFTPKVEEKKEEDLLSLPSKDEIMKADDSFSFSKLVNQIKARIEQSYRKDEDESGLKETEQEEILNVVECCLKKSTVKSCIAWAKPTMKVFLKYLFDNRSHWNEANKQKISELLKNLNSGKINKLEKPDGGKSGFDEKDKRWKSANIANPRNKK